MNKYKKGFTLIELLVVVAIIGILASVVLASLSTARNKGKDAAVKSQLSSMRAQAELSATSGTYPSDLCTNALSVLLSATVKSTVVTTTLNTVLGTGGSFTSVTCHEKADQSAWAVDAPLSPSSTMFCVDSTGLAKQESVVLSPFQFSCPP
jgi:prepilin-type N-terminal cleavage/methylation domain-containing protein